MEYVKSPINYIGNKYKSLDQIVPLFPKDISTFVDIFGGSGTVLLNTNADYYIYNDINNYIVEIFKGICSNENSFIFDNIDSIIEKYLLSKDNLGGFLKLREDYNNGYNNWIVLFVLMCFSFNYQSRFNNSGKYNSSFGKNRSSFNENTVKNIIKIKEITKGKCINFINNSFEVFDFSNLNSTDFVYLDPPYFGSVGNYNDGKRGFEGWTENHETSLLKILDDLNDKNIKWALSNNLLPNSKLVEWSKKYNINSINCNYSNCNYQKKDKETKDIEVLITNY